MTFRSYFFRAPNIDPLVVTMSGVRAGERLIQIGVDEPAYAAAIAGKVGINGEASLILPEGAETARVQVALGREGIAGARVSTLDQLSEDSATSDVVVIHSRHGLLTNLEKDGRQALLHECCRVLRPHGRLVVVEAGPEAQTLLSRLTGQRPRAVQEAAVTIGDLHTAGFRPVRLLAERDGYRFVEGFRP